MSQFTRQGNGFIGGMSPGGGGSGSGTTLDQVRMRRAAAQATSAGDNDIILDTEDYDKGSGIGDLVNGYVVIAIAGLYQLTGSGSNTVASNNTQVFISVNGTKIIRAVNSQAGSGNLDNQTVSTTVELAVGDIVRLGLFTNGNESTDTALEDQMTLQVIQQPSTVAVDASALTPTNIGLVSSNITSVQNPGTGNPLIMDVVSLSEDITETLSTTGLVTLAAGKTYKLSAGLRLEPPSGPGFSLWYIRTSTGTNISPLFSNESLNQNSLNGPLDNTEVFYKPTSDVQVGMYLDAGSSLGEAGEGSYFNVQEMTTSTVEQVDPTLLTPTTLERIQVYASGSGSALADGAGHKPLFDSTYFTTGGLTLANNKVTLFADKTYELTATVRSGSNSLNGFTFYDYTNDAPISLINISNNATTQTRNGGITTIVTPVTDIEVSLDVLSANTITSDANGSSYMTIQQLPSSTVTQIDPTLVTPTTLTYAYLNEQAAVSGTTIQNISTSNIATPLVVADASKALDLSTPTNTDISGVTAGATDITIGTAGRYDVEAKVHGRGITNVNMYAQLVKNGTTILNVSQLEFTGPQEVASWVLNWSGTLAATDTLDIRIEGESGVVSLLGYTLNVKESTVSTVIAAGDAAYNVQTGADYTAIEIGLYRDLTFEVSSTSDNDEVITFPIAFSAAPKEWDIQLTMSANSGQGSEGGAVTNGTITASTVTLNRVDTIDNAANPVWLIRVRGLI